MKPVYSACLDRHKAPFIQYDGQMYHCCNVQNKPAFLFPEFHLDNGRIDDILNSKEWLSFAQRTNEEPYLPACSAICSVASRNLDGKEPVPMRKYVEAHVELTSRCTMECLRCARTIFKDKGVYEVGDLSLDHIKNIAESRSFDHVDLCGGLGDPIFHRQLHDALNLFNRNGKTFKITTAGSNRTERWWEETAKLMIQNRKNSITFSVDGLEDTNHIYRVNSKWDSIIKGMEICAKYDVDAKWKFIVFKHNEHQLDEALELAQSMNMSFGVVRSGRFGTRFSKNLAYEDDPLLPSDPKNYNLHSSSNQHNKLIKPQ